MFIIATQSPSTALNAYFIGSEVAKLAGWSCPGFSHAGIAKTYETEDEAKQDSKNFKTQGYVVRKATLRELARFRLEQKALAYGRSKEWSFAGEMALGRRLHRVRSRFAS